MRVYRRLAAWAAALGFAIAAVTIRRSNKNYLVEVARRCAPLRVVIELRHKSWFDGDNQAETLDFLRRNHLPFVSVDMPQGFTSSIPPVLVHVLMNNCRGDYAQRNAATLAGLLED